MGFTLPGPPQTGHFVRVLDDKLAVVPLPGDDIMILFFPEQLQDKVPELDLPGPRARLGLVGPFWEGDPCEKRDKRAEGLVCGTEAPRTTVNEVVGQHMLEITRKRTPLHLSDVDLKRIR